MKKRERQKNSGAFMIVVSTSSIQDRSMIIYCNTNKGGGMRRGIGVEGRKEGS